MLTGSSKRKTGDLNHPVLVALVLVANAAWVRLTFVNEISLRGSAFDMPALQHLMAIELNTTQLALQLQRVPFSSQPVIAPYLLAISKVPLPLWLWELIDHKSGSCFQVQIPADG